MNMQQSTGFKKPPHSTLGSSAKSLHSHFGKKAKKAVPGETKTRRFRLLSQIQSVLYKSDAEHTEQHRTCWCHRSARKDHVDVWSSENSARFVGVNTCGSVWTCPICAPIVQEVRRSEISMGMSSWLKEGGFVLMMTLTHPHEADLPLAEQLAMRKKAEQTFTNGATFKRFKENCERAGHIRSLECTWGIEHGWHPHTHVLLFVKNNPLEGMSAEELADPRQYRGIILEMRDAWIKACIKAGLATSRNITDMEGAAFQIQGGEKAAEYVAKFGRDERWGFSSEMTATLAKSGRAADVFGEMHFTPFQMIAWAENEEDKSVKALLNAKFREYAEAFTGKRAITWTPGLKDLLKIDEMDDAQILEAHEKEPLPEETLRGSLTTDQYSVLIKRNHLGEFLEYVRSCCTNDETSQDDINEYISHLADQPSRYGGKILVKNTFSKNFSEIH